MISLALIPPEKVSSGFEYLLDEMPEGHDLEQFTDYMIDNWIESASHPISMWNHYDNIEDPRTNNHVEGYHAKLDKIIVNKKPNIWLFIETIKNEESTYNLNYERLENNVLRLRVRSRKCVERDNFILKRRCEYLVDKDLIIFLEKLSGVIHDYSE
jgi:hypothetical protein